jgi:hypothetical protein
VVAHDWRVVIGLYMSLASGDQLGTRPFAQASG